MGVLDNVRGAFDDAGDKAEDVFEAAKRRAVEAIDDLKAKLDVDDDGVNTVGEIFAAAQAQASNAIAGIKNAVSGDDDTPVGEARVIGGQAADPTASGPAESVDGLTSGDDEQRPGTL